MSLDRQPVLKGDLIELRPLRAEDFEDLYAIAADPLIWEQHPVKHRHERAGFLAPFARDQGSTRGAGTVISTRSPPPPSNNDDGRVALRDGVEVCVHVARRNSGSITNWSPLALARRA